MVSVQIVIPVEQHRATIPANSNTGKFDRDLNMETKTLPCVDTIVYLSISLPGGVDGKDSSDKGGQICFASLTNNLHCNPWTKLEKRVVEFTQLRKEVLAKLDPLEKLALGLS